MTFIKLPLQHHASAHQLLAQQGLGDNRQVVEQLLAGASYGKLAEQEMLFVQEQSAEYFYLVLSGRMDTLRVNGEGDEHIIQHVPAGQLLAPIVMFMEDGLYPVSCRAAAPSELCRISRSNLHRTCLSHPPLALHMLKLAGRALNRRTHEVDSLVGRTTPERLAGYLLGLIQDSLQPVQLPLSQRQLATKLGIRAETLSRLLADWQRQGLIQGQRRCWQIADRVGLERIALAGE
jgi:CRP-like cAMP-binding protein